MKKLLISALALMASLGMSAQLLTINSMEKVALPEGLYVNVPTMSPDGSFVVVSDVASDGLTQVMLDGTPAKAIAASASGYDVRISQDGSQVVYRQSTVGKDNLRYTSLRSVSLLNGKEVEIVKPSRRLNAGIALAGNTVTAVENGRARVRKLDGGSAEASAVVSINYGHLDYTKDGKTVTLDPQGRGSYLWPQLSPDGTKVVYYLAGRGCFVCNVDGSNPIALGMLRAAKWLNNEIVVGMNDVDDGESVQTSSVIASNLAGVRQVLTTDAVIAMYPTASADGHRVAFATPQGELYIMNIK